MTAETHFSKHLDSFRNRLKGFEIADYKWLVKGDISGIQDFIFSVASSKASKSLKGRSFFVQALSKLGIRLLRQELGESNTEVFYDGGGNFYLLSKVPVGKAIEKAYKTINEDCKKSEIYLSLAELPIEKLKFSEVWQTINQLSNEAKLRKFNSDFFSFSPYPSPEKELDAKTEEEFERGFRYDLVTDKLLRDFNSKFDFTSSSQPGVDDIGVAFFGFRMVLNSGNLILEDWVNGLPRWNEDLLKESLIEQRRESANRNPKAKISIPKKNNIIEFADLAHFAYTRTGTDKLAVLKMDVDNLGKLFGGLQDWSGAKKASAAMSWFFGAFMSELLDESFEYKDEKGVVKTAKFADNIYVVFSGGDDTFMVGAWDAVFEFAHCLHENFKAFVTELQNSKIEGLPKDKDITLSAALVVVDPKFPVVRFAEQAEEALKEAKRWGSEKGKRALKNRISVFRQILDWEEFGDSRKIGDYLAGMIKSKEASRGIIERIKGIAYDYERLADRAATKQSVPGPKVHRLIYTLKKWIPEPGKEESAKSANEKFIEKTAHDFINGLLQSFSTKQKVSYPKFPVAARWAEFLTRK
jgi:CRISPR-associated protein Csm1